MKTRIIGIVLLVNAAYIAALPSATIFYVLNVLLHLGLGVAFLIMVRQKPVVALIGLAAIPALYLIKAGNTTDHRFWLYAHVALGVAAMMWWARSRAVLVALLALLPFITRPRPAQRIANPTLTPVSMEEEGEGPKGPFWPSSVRTNVGLVPSSYFLDSEHCGTCHKDIYEQWKGSVHHFASFNNQFYRRSIEYMQEKQGTTKPSRWCAGCHDHAVILTGRWEKPIKD